MSEHNTRHLLLLAIDQRERLRAALKAIVTEGLKQPPPPVADLVAIAAEALKGKRAMYDEKRSPPRDA
jgi:hypothetical protein